MNTKKDYPNTIVANLWTAGRDSQHYKSMPIDAKLYDLLQSYEIGDILFIRRRTKEAVQDAKNPETAPKAFLERIPAAVEAAYKAANPRQRNTESL